MSLTSLFQALSPIFFKLGIPNFDLQKGNFMFFVTRACSYPVNVNRAENFIKTVSTQIVLKSKNIRSNEL